LGVVLSMIRAHTVVLTLSAVCCFLLLTYSIYIKYFSHRRVRILAMEVLAPLTVRLSLDLPAEYGTKLFKPALAGQYFYLRPLIPGIQTRSRPYTLCALPTAGQVRLDFCVKAEDEAGLKLFDAAAQFMPQNLDHPWMADISRPHGRFFLKPAASKQKYQSEKGPIVGLAQGLGALALIAIARDLGENGSMRRFLLIWVANTRDELVYFNELADIAQKRRNFSFIPILLHDPLWQGCKGSPDAAVLQKHAANELAQPNCKVMVSGSQLFVKKIKRELRVLAIPAHMIQAYSTLRRYDYDD
jgi:NAD(P)H-flavin reductase